MPAQLVQLLENAVLKATETWYRQTDENASGADVMVFSKSEIGVEMNPMQQKGGGGSLSAPISPPPSSSYTETGANTHIATKDKDSTAIVISSKADSDDEYGLRGFSAEEGRK